MFQPAFRPRCCTTLSTFGFAVKVGETIQRVAWGAVQRGATVRPQEGKQEGEGYHPEQEAMKSRWTGGFLIQEDGRGLLSMRHRPREPVHFKLEHRVQDRAPTHAPPLVPMSGGRYAGRETLRRQAPKKKT